MGKITNPVRFSAYFGLDPDFLIEKGALDPTLNLDTNLFIDPMLLETSQHRVIREDAFQSYSQHFSNVITLLNASQSKNDTYWRQARRLMSFPEIKNTCLGYGSSSVSGSGSGSSITDVVMQTACDVVRLGITDPNMFVVMAIFEEGIGPDRISDMTTNVIVESLIKFTEDVLKGTSVPTTLVRITAGNGRSYSAHLPINPFIKGGKTGVLLVPSDIVRDLPIAHVWSDISDAAHRSHVVRHGVNRQIGEIWERKTLKDKATLKDWALHSPSGFQQLLDSLKAVDTTPYDTKKDPKGELYWNHILETIAQAEPCRIEQPEQWTFEAVKLVTEQIIAQFRFLIEDRRLSEELYSDGKPRPEKSAQRMFFAVAHSYCKANNIDLTPEADTGNGPVDFKLSVGYSGRVLVEIKLSTNTKLVTGYTRQLEAYARAEEPVCCYYLVIDVGQMGNKRKQLNIIQKQRNEKHYPTKFIRYIDGLRRPPASHL